MSLSQDDLRGVLDYDPETGEFTWKVSRKGRPRDCVGADDAKGYREIRIDGGRYLAHRLAWLWMTGEWPIDQIDHVDCDPSNNAFSNLREATRSENGCNRPKPTGNTSGFKGVSFDKRRSRWKSYITLHGKLHYLGHHDSPEQAHAAYLIAAKRLHKEFAYETADDLP